MSRLRIHNGMNRELFRRAARLLKPCNVLLDIGCGLRPQNMVECNRHICVEPHGEYADELEGEGYEVIRKTGIEGLMDCDTVMALDVIEHMEREDGLRFLERALEVSRGQVVIFTPLGFMPQEGSVVVDGVDVDPWGMQGQEWQRHRSGWVVGDFLPSEGWVCEVAENFHSGGYGAFFAVHTKGGD